MDAPNPKDAFGQSKIQFHFVPPIAEVYLALGMEEGAEKYGPFNWRQHPVIATVYYDAARRHLLAWLEGEEEDSKTGRPHLGYAMACAAILADAQLYGNLIDDRQKTPYDKSIGTVLESFAQQRAGRQPAGTKVQERLDFLRESLKK